MKTRRELKFFFFIFVSFLSSSLLFSTLPDCPLLYTARDEYTSVLCGEENVFIGGRALGFVYVKAGK